VTISTEHEGGYVIAVRRLAAILVEGSTLRSTLDELLAVARSAAPAVDALTVTAVADDGSYATAATTDDAAREVDEFEYDIDEGPCVAALTTGDEQLVRDTSTDDRWPRFARAAASAGFGTVAGLPLVTPEGQVQGALNVFTRAADALDEDTLALLRRVTVPAGVVLANARAYRRADALGDDLARQLEQQARWHRAVGLVLGRAGGDQQQAVATLRRTAEAEQIEVTELVDRLLAGEAVELRRP
jgi:GAF domain-containing protein